MMHTAAERTVFSLVVRKREKPVLRSNSGAGKAETSIYEMKEYSSYEERLIGEEEQLVQRRRQRRELKKKLRARQVRRQKRIAVLAVLFSVVFLLVGTQVVMHAYAKSRLSDAVLSYRKTVKKYAKREKISGRVNTLLAIMMVESMGKGSDVMQSSESKGLPRNSLGPEESIEQACVYYAALVKIAKSKGIKDEKAVIQSYNFGPGYLDYISKKGKKHSQKLATAYAKEMAAGQKIRYLNLYAIRKNGGWLYKFGNMFYVKLVERYI